MNLRPALLLCGVILIAGAPVRADEIASPGFAKAFPNLDISTIGRSSLKLSAAMNADMPATSAPAVMYSDKFKANHAFDGWDSARSEDLATFFPSPSDMDIHSVSLNDLYFGQGLFHTGHLGEAWSMKEDREKDRDHDRGRRGVRPTQVPEPGSFSLLLIGLATFGIFALRRR
jgi:PEP-CTERM motif